MHEIGHAIGLKHPNQTVDDYATGVFEDNTAPDDPKVTIMPRPMAECRTSHLLPLDMAAAASIYGSPGSGAAGTPTGSGEVIIPIRGSGALSPRGAWNSVTIRMTRLPVRWQTIQGSNSVSSWTWNPASQTMTQTATPADEVLHGTSVNDVIIANYGTDSLFGLDGNNTLYGGTLNSSVDTFYGGPNADTMYGGALVPAGGTFVQGVGDYTFFAGGGTESMVGGGTDGSSSGGTDNFYDGTYDGFGSGGTDHMVGDGKTDNFYVGSTNTTVTENNSASNATLYTKVSYTLPKYVDTLYLYAGGLTGTANNDANVSMFGSGDGANTLVGGGGYNYMVGGPDNDTFVAGSGGGSMYGQTGDNTFEFKSVADGNYYLGDFNLGTNIIDLTGIATTYGQPLQFIGNAAFTHTGQVQTITDGNTINVNVDTATSGVVNFDINVFNNGAALTASDFDWRAIAPERLS